MEYLTLARHLLAPEETERQQLLARHAGQADLQLAYALKQLYDDLEGSEPVQAAAVAPALQTLANLTRSDQIQALADWTAGLSALDSGRVEDAVTHLEAAAGRFTLTGDGLRAAQTQLGMMHARALLGHYEQALQSGLSALDFFSVTDNAGATGKVEQNLGNIYFLRDQYVEAEAFYQRARQRFIALDDQKQLAQAENCLGAALAAQQRLPEAEAMHRAALARAEAAGMTVTLAEIECNLGCLELFRGRFDLALNYLERSRRRYAELGMPHESAIAELELADAYLELNLIPEAITIYAQVTPVFAALGMHGEQARALVYHARALLVQGAREPAQALLIMARTIYQRARHLVGEAVVVLFEAQVHFMAADYRGAAILADEAATTFAAVGARRRWLLARWLQGESFRLQGQWKDAYTILTSVLLDAETWVVPPITQQCHTSLGLLAIAQGESARAEAAFQQAVTLIEAMRAPLPAEELRIAFLIDKLTPYSELVRLCLADGTPTRQIEAFHYIERARSRTLVDMMSRAFDLQLDRPDAQTTPIARQLLEQVKQLREELNWLYSLLNHSDDVAATRSVQLLATINDAIATRETALLALLRQLQQGPPQRDTPQSSRGDQYQVDIVEFAQLQRDLGTHTVLVEYFTLDEELSALVVTDGGIDIVPLTATLEEISETLAQLRFQIGALQPGMARIHPHLPQLMARTRHHLATLYDQLLRPLAAIFADRRLLVAPHRDLHYVPFHALFDGSAYVIEQREVCYTPSATVLHNCLHAPVRNHRRAVLVGVPDEYAPRVTDEIAALTELFPEAVTLVGSKATYSALHTHAPTADILHLACHGRFRSDNPLFSTLRLADGWLTARDAYHLELNCDLVTLSACETGVHARLAGDELIGLARGFFAAGAPSLLVSLWKVDDEAAAGLMPLFYQRLMAGDNLAAALRYAQCQLMHSHPHPYFWSPFVLLGRW